MLPSDGPDWVTWNPVTDSVPNCPSRLFGNERTIKAVLSVVAAYRAAHPNAPRVLVGDISWRNGGRMEQHVSHQNGLDVDVYYPRLDRCCSAPAHTGQIDNAPRPGPARPLPRRRCGDRLRRLLDAVVPVPAAW